MDDASFLEGAALVVGYLAGAAALGGFLGRSERVLNQARKDEVERGTVLMGLVALGIALLALAAGQRV